MHDIIRISAAVVMLDFDVCCVRSYTLLCYGYATPDRRFAAKGKGKGKRVFV